ncbi:MAG: hypothetical protein AUI36_31165, partial [Cyanobacteria bacterium 13_1_40CM_2_61_4]
VVDDAIKRLIKKHDPHAPAVSRSTWDKALAPHVHKAFQHLSRRPLLDMRFWHWVCTVKFPECVLLRWYGKVPRHRGEAVAASPALRSRFLGSPTLNGVSRNSFARIYWCAEALYTTPVGYKLAEQALDNQDFFQAIFERNFGIYSPAARACLAVLKNSNENARRTATRKLNHYLTTIAVETLTQKDIEKLLSQ